MALLENVEGYFTQLMVELEDETEGEFCFTMFTYFQGHLYKGYHSLHAVCNGKYLALLKALDSQEKNNPKIEP